MENENNSKRFMVLMQIDVQDSPIVPPRPGNCYLGYLQESFKDYQEANKKLNELRALKYCVELENAWLYTNTSEITQQVDPRDPTQIAVGARMGGFILPTTEYAAIRGSNVVCPVTTWTWVRDSMRRDLERVIESAGEKLTLQRAHKSGLSTASPADLAKLDQQTH